MRNSDASDVEPRAGLATWHLCWQAAVGREFFSDVSLYGRVQARLVDAHRRRGGQLLDYVLLPTEIHVVSVLPSGETPGGIARAVGNVVSRWVRQSQPITSPVLAAPFRAHRLLSLGELREELRMLAWRPVFQRQCRTPIHHSHGALRVALGLRTSPPGFNARPMLQAFDSSVVEARAALKAWIARRPADRDLLAWELARGLRLACGRSSPQRSVAVDLRGTAAAALVAEGGSAGIDGALEVLGRWAAARLGIAGPLESLPSVDPRGVRCRALVGCLAVRHRICSAASVARYFGRAKATLSEQMAAARKRPSEQLLIATPVEVILAEVAAVRRRK
ncbi:hypothetical protein [Aquabacterium humicola]|uniref:hypothetical protein n=1 Tax=Aquabacterium humicola TaxID=3237377 RepID=UPI002542DCEA|nr:hypothetical protein [Rubrivivax pictus]